MDENHDWTEDELATLDAIFEMSREKYVCEIIDHDADDDEFLVAWTDKDGKEWAAWFSRRLINEIFTDAVVN